MYNSFIREVKESIRGLRGSSEVLSYLYRKRDRLADMRDSVRYLYNESVDEYSQENIVQNILDDIKREAITILKKFAVVAIRATREFDLQQFRAPLLSAIEDERTIELNWNKRRNIVQIRINLDETAGTSHDYYRAVKKTREELGIGKKGGIGSDALRSFMWKEKYYKPAREGGTIPQPKPNKDGKPKKVREYNVAKYINAYKRTMRSRISNFGGLAPYWEIINNGNKSGSSNFGRKQSSMGLLTIEEEIESGWGAEESDNGYPYPQYGPTHFVEKAAREIKKRANERISDSFIPLTDKIKELKNELDYIDKALAVIDRLISRQITHMENYLREEKPIPREAITLVTAKKQIGENYGDVDFGKLKKVMEGIENKTTDPRGRYNVGKKGHPVRMRVANITALYEKYKEEQ